MRIGDAEVTIGSNCVLTEYPDGTTVFALPNYEPEDYARAESLGYGEGDKAVDAMTRDHDVLHSLLAEARGWPHSASLWAVAHKTTGGMLADEEERIVMLLHRVSQMGVQRLLKSEAVQRTKKVV